MKKQLLAVIGMVCTLAACSEVLEETPEVNEDGVYATLEQPTSIDTRSLTYDKENNELVFTWGKGENLMAIGNGDVAMFRTLNADVASSKLESKGFQLMDGVTYYAYIPAKSLPTSETVIPVSLLDQRQSENNNSAHLKDYDYACTTATKDEGSNTLQFDLKNQIGWIIVEHAFTEDVKNVTSLTISAEDDIFVTEGTLDVATSKLTGETTASQITLDLGKKGGDGLSFSAGELFRGFFTIVPVDLSGKTLNIVATTKDGTNKELGTFIQESAKIAKNQYGLIRTSSTVAPVATLNGKEFSSLEGAIAAAEAIAASNNKATITLTNDIKGSFTIANPTSKNAEIVLDLNGHSITAENEGESAIIVKQGEVWLKNGTIESKNFVGVKLDSQAKGASVYLVDCTVNSVQGAVCTGTATGCKIVIYGGSFSATNNAVIAGNGSLNYKKDGKDTGVAREKGNTITISANKGNVPVFNGSTNKTDNVACGLYSPWKDVITINAAKFNVENGVGILCRGGKITVNDAEISVTGGDRVGKVADGKLMVPCTTFYKDSNCGYPDIENADIDIKGGMYSDDAGKPYVPADGYSYESTGETPLAYKVVTNETRLTEAVSTVEKDGTVTIDYHVSLRNQLKIQKDFTLTLLGGTSNSAYIEGDCKSPVLHFCQDGGKNTITGQGTIFGGADSDAAILVNGKGQTLSIDCEKEDYIQITGGNSSDFASAITIWDGKLVINNGTFISGTDASGNNSPAIYLMPMDQYDAPELEINGGVFCPAISSGGSAKFLINCYDDDIARCKITIKGGTFVGFNPAASTADTKDGKPANWVADGYEVVQDGELYTVVASKVTSVASQEELNNAIKGTAKGESTTVALPSGSTFTLDNGIANDNNGGSLRNITFVGDGHRL